MLDWMCVCVHLRPHAPCFWLTDISQQQISSVHFACKLLISKASFACVSCLQTINQRNVGFTVLRTFKLLYTVYVYDEEQDTFKPLPDMPEDLPLQIFNARKALALIDAGDNPLPCHLVSGLLFLPF